VAGAKDIPPATFGNSQTPFAQSCSLEKRIISFLSRLLQHEPADQTSTDDASRHLQQSTEIRRIEAIYETELLRTTRFPKAHESNAIIEDWVEQVVRNWEVLCGPKWHDEELGEGGRNAVGRGRT